MSIATVLIGNGIGMALDPQYFSMKAGINHSWGTLPKERREIILSITGKKPESEMELENCHKIMTHCTELLKIRKEFLNKNGSDFPTAYQEFIFHTARYYFERPEELPEEFIDNFIKFIKAQDRCHVATLNYDKLLYYPFINKSILRGYSGSLIDGILTGESGIGFDKKNLATFKDNLGYYLHLHGSPILYSEEEKISKDTVEFCPSGPIDGNKNYEHIVLSHTKEKPEIISNSRILSSYNEYFYFALFDSTELIIVGYSGEDTHVNEKIKVWVQHNNSYKKKIKIVIIQWKNATADETTWKEKLLPKNDDNYNDTVDFIFKPFENILDFKFDNI